MKQASPNAESSVLEAVQRVHAMIDDVVDGGINPNNIFICGFSQGGLSLSPLLYLPYVTHLWPLNLTLPGPICNHMLDQIYLCLKFK